MSITLDLPPALEAALEADAAAQGLEPSALILQLVADRYTPSESREEEDIALWAALAAPAHRFDPDAPRRRYNVPIGRSREEISAAADAEIAALDPEKRREAEQLGLI